MVRTMRSGVLAVAVLALVGLLAPAAQAVEGAGGPRGSALIFPYYNTTAGYRTFLRVTQAAPDNSIGTQDIALHNFYLETFRDPFTNSDVCTEFDRFRPITVNDAEIWDVRAEFPQATQGYALTYLVDRNNVAGIITFGGNLGWDSLLGESVVVNTVEGWIVAVSSIPVLWDPTGAQPAFSITDPNFILAEAEGPTIGAADGADTDYDFITFGNEFLAHFLNPNANVDPTDYVILPFSIIVGDDGGSAWAQPRENFDGGTNQWTFLGDWFDHDENRFNIPISVIRCWGFRSIGQLTLNGALTAPRGFGWIWLRTFPAVACYVPGCETAVIFQLEDPVPNAGFGWGHYPARRARFLPPAISPYFDPDTGANDGKTTNENF